MPRVRSLCVVVIALLATACVKAPSKGVSLQNVNADIVFGVAKEESVVGPSIAESLGGEEAPQPGDFEFAAPKKSPSASVLTTEKRAEPCPEASRSAAAPQEAPLNAEGLPLPGAYRWKYEGTREVSTLPGKLFPFSGFERRIVRKVAQINSTDFRFETLQTQVNGPDVLATTFKVRTAAVAQRPPGVPDQRVGDPDRGLSIEKMDVLDSKTGSSKGVFIPTPSVLVLGLPVMAAERFTAAGTDQSSRETLQIAGFVPKRELVDACGTLIDGWRIEMTRTFSGSSQFRQGQGKYVMVVATQKGAMPISEYMEFQNANEKVTVTYSIGQLNPDTP